MTDKMQKFDEFSLDQDITIYLERLEQFFTANKVTEEDIKVANLLNSIGLTAYKLLRNLCLPNLPKDKSFNDLTSLLKEHCCPRVNAWRERRKFYNAKQLEHETINEWCLKLSKLSENCSFGSDLNKVLCDKFVSGIFNNKIFERLCEEKISENNKYEKLKEISINKEDLIQNQEEVQFQICSNFPPSRQVVERHNGFDGQPSKAPNRSWPKMNHVTEKKQRNKPRTQRMSTGARNESGKMQSTRSRADGSNTGSNVNSNQQQQWKTCMVCGISHGGKCRFRYSYCNICSKKGHLSRVCKKKL